MNLVDELHATFLDGRIEEELPPGPLAVAARPTLLRVKRMAGRAQVLADLDKLEADRDR